MSAKQKKPANTAFKQQRLKAWQPILTPKTVLPTFFAIGAIFVPLGIGLFIASDRVSQIIFDYTKCSDTIGNIFYPLNLLVGPTFTSANVSPPVKQWKYDVATKTCTIDFEIPEVFLKPVFQYYRLTNFYQNHRRYVKSFDPDQLKGLIPVNGTKYTGLSVSCAPVINPSDAIQKQYYPCGLIANSFFTDQISNLTRVDSISSGVVYAFSQQGIAWPADAQKFKKSEWASKTDEEIKASVVPPPHWTNIPRFANGYNASNFPDISTWESLQVWMRTAGLPNFRKLNGKNLNEDLSKGIYRIEIVSTFEVNNFGGTKSIVISTSSILGGKNPFLGIAYMAVGSLCIILGIIFLIRHMIKPRKLGDHTYLSWNQPSQRPTGGAAGQEDPRYERNANMR